jgi:hypothetical protein
MMGVIVMISNQEAEWKLPRRAAAADKKAPTNAIVNSLERSMTIIKPQIKDHVNQNCKEIRMKRLTIPIVLLAIMVMVSTAMAAGTVTVSEYRYAEGQSMTIKLACVGDASDGSVPATVIDSNTLSEAYWTGKYYFYEIWVEASAVTAPDAADITITMAEGEQLFDQNSVIPASGTTEGTVTKYRLVTGKMTMTVENQDTASGTYDVYIKLVQ